MRRVIEKDSIIAWNKAIDTMKADAKNAGLWNDVKFIISKPRRARIAVNLSKLDKLANEGEFIVVPGKVLSFGNISHKFKVAAVEFSAGAHEKLKESGCEIVGMDQMFKKENPRIIV